MSKIRKKMHIGIWIITVLFFGSIFLYFGMGGELDRKEQSKKNKVILKIGKETIPREMYDYYYTQFMNSSQQRITNYQMKMAVAATTVRQILQQEVLIKEAGKRGLKVSSSEIKTRIKSDMDRMLGPLDEPKNPGLADRVKTWFAENRKTKEYKQEIATAGISYKIYKEAIRRELLAEKARNVIAQEQLEAEAKKVEQKARDAWRKLDAGESFASIAKEYSEDEATAETEGMLGWKNRSELDQAVADMAFRLKPGAYSEPIRSSLGFQIIMVEAVKKPSGEEYEKFRQDKLAEIQKQQADGQKVQMPSEREMQRLYESVLLKHILLKLPDTRTLITQWADKRIADKSFKYEVMDPEIKAFMALQDALDPEKGGFTQKGLDGALDAYNKALKEEKENYQLYYQLGFIYEQKNDLLNKELDVAQGDKKDDGKDFSDPYASDDSAENKDDSKKDKEPEKTVKHLDSSYESYKKAYDMARDAGDDNPDIIIGLARVSRMLGLYGKKDVAKYKKQARAYYTEAFDFSLDLTVATLYRLREIRDALMELDGDPKTIKDLDTAIADIEEEMGMGQQGDINQFNVGGGEGDPHSVTIDGEDGEPVELNEEDLKALQEMLKNQQAAPDGAAGAPETAGNADTTDAPESVPATTGGAQQ
jgi:hypothetical protein